MRSDCRYSSPLRLLSALRLAPTDPDTDSTKERFRIGEAEITLVNNSAARPLAAPTYLPAWAPVFPGAELRSKVVEWQGNSVIGRGTPYSPTADFSEAVRFYDEYYRNRAIAPVSIFEGRFGKSYWFDVRNGYQSMLNVQKLGDGKVDIAQTASRWRGALPSGQAALASL